MVAYRGSRSVVNIETWRKRIRGTTTWCMIRQTFVKGIERNVHRHLEETKAAAHRHAREIRAEVRPGIELAVAALLAANAESTHHDVVRIATGQGMQIGIEAAAAIVIVVMGGGS